MRNFWATGRSAHTHIKRAYFFVFFFAASVGWGERDASAFCVFFCVLCEVRSPCLRRNFSGKMRVDGNKFLFNEVTLNGQRKMVCLLHALAIYHCAV